MTYFQDERVVLSDGDSSLRVNLTGFTREIYVKRYIGHYLCDVTNGYSSDSATAMLTIVGVTAERG